MQLDATFGIWYVRDRATADRVLTDGRLSACTIQAMMQHPATGDLGPNLAALREELAAWFLYLDDPAHGQLRSTVQRCFTPRVLAGMETRVDDAAGRLLGELAPAGTADLVPAYAERLPTLALGALLGLEGVDERDLRSWSDAVGRFIGFPTAEGATEALRALRAIGDALEARADERRRAADPQDDLLGHLVRAVVDGRLTTQELRSVGHMLLFAGLETTRDLLAEVFVALATEREATATVTADPQLVDGFVGEVLRLRPPVYWAMRVAPEELDVEGNAVSAGQFVGADLMACNRDPGLFPEPEHFDVRRPPGKHLSFGHGPHHCIGAMLARMEARITVLRALEHLPGLRLTLPLEELVMRPSLVYQGRQNVPAVWHT